MPQTIDRAHPILAGLAEPALLRADAQPTSMDAF